MRKALWFAVGAGLLAAAVLTPLQVSRAKSPPVPNGFMANSITWLTPSHGWILGAAPCNGHTCADVITSTDSGATWSLVGTVPAPVEQLSNPSFGITEIRFTSASVGWAFGPSLYLTTNGGHTWKAQAIPGGGHHVVALSTSSTATYVIVSSCTFNAWFSCRKPMTLLRRSAAGGKWKKVSLGLPMSFGAAGIALHGGSVYVWDELIEFGMPDRLYSSTDGIHFIARKSPCSHAQDLTLTDVVATSARNVDLLCDGDPGFSKAEKTVYRSTNMAKNVTYMGMLQPFGIVAQLAASPSGHLAVSSWSDGSFMDYNDGKGTTWTRVIASGDGGAGWNDIQFSTNTDAWVVYGPYELPAQAGLILVTHDAGHHWKPITL
jgi:hypothetical protein